MLEKEVMNSDGHISVTGQQVVVSLKRKKVE